MQEKGFSPLWILRWHSRFPERQTDRNSFLSYWSCGERTDRSVPGQTRVPDATFLTEAPPAVLTYVRLFPRVELHVVPQRARVSQQLGAERALHLGQETGIRGGFLLHVHEDQILMGGVRSQVRCIRSAFIPPLFLFSLHSLT